jgi:hypothetical protein
MTLMFDGLSNLPDMHNKGLLTMFMQCEELGIWRIDKLCND